MATSQANGIDTHSAIRKVPRRNTHEVIKIPKAPANASFKFGFCADRNARRRRKMEDSHCFAYDFDGVKDQGVLAVFDGHGGKSAADWCADNFLRVLSEAMHKHSDSPVPEIFDWTFRMADSQLTAENEIFSGCTVVAALMRTEERKGKQRVLYTANVGDARAVLYRDGKAVRLTYDHKGSDPNEQRRIRDSGGFIAHDRVSGMLAVTRALGDAELKEFIAGRPFTCEVVLNETDQMLILACDGLWDMCTDQEACDFVAETKDDPQECAELLVDYAMEKGSADNLSVLVVRLQSKSSG